MITWPDGRFFEGNFLNNKRHGYGRMTWPDGRSYEGEWLEGKEFKKRKTSDHNEGVGLLRRGEYEK